MVSRTMSTAISVKEISEEVGDALRAVLVFDEGLIPIYRREDVSQKYLKEEFKVIHDEFRASSLASPYLENTWNLGEHDCTIYTFSEGLIFHVMGEENEVVVSIDRDTKVDLFSLIETCAEFVS